MNKKNILLVIGVIILVAMLGIFAYIQKDYQTVVNDEETVKTDVTTDVETNDTQMERIKTEAKVGTTLEIETEGNEDEIMMQTLVNIFSDIDTEKGIKADVDEDVLTEVEKIFDKAVDAGTGDNEQLSGNNDDGKMSDDEFITELMKLFEE